MQHRFWLRRRHRTHHITYLMAPHFSSQHTHTHRIVVNILYFFGVCVCGRHLANIHYIYCVNISVFICSKIYIELLYTHTVAAGVLCCAKIYLTEKRITCMCVCVHYIIYVPLRWCTTVISRHTSRFLLYTPPCRFTAPPPTYDWFVFGWNILSIRLRPDFFFILSFRVEKYISSSKCVHFPHNLTSRIFMYIIYHLFFQRTPSQMNVFFHWEVFKNLRYILTQKHTHTRVCCCTYLNHMLLLI